MPVRLLLEPLGGLHQMEPSQNSQNLQGIRASIQFPRTVHVCWDLAPWSALTSNPKQNNYSKARPERGGCAREAPESKHNTSVEFPGMSEAKPMQGPLELALLISNPSYSTGPKPEATHLKQVLNYLGPHYYWASVGKQGKFANKRQLTVDKTLNIRFTGAFCPQSEGQGKIFGTRAQQVAQLHGKTTKLVRS